MIEDHRTGLPPAQPLDPRVSLWVAPAVADAAVREGVAGRLWTRQGSGSRCAAGRRRIRLRIG